MFPFWTISLLSIPIPTAVLPTKKEALDKAEVAIVVEVCGSLNCPPNVCLFPLELILPEAVIWLTFFMSFPPKSKSWVAVWLPKLSAPPPP